jgi:hypothetical protein
MGRPGLKAIVVHGEEAASLAFAESIRERFGCETHVPAWGETMDLSTMERSPAGAEGAVELKVHSEVAELKAAIDVLVEKYNRAGGTKAGSLAKDLEQDIRDLKEMVEMISGEL